MLEIKIDKLQELLKDKFDIKNIIKISSHKSNHLTGWIGILNIIAEGQDARIYDIDIRKAVEENRLLNQNIIDHGLIENDQANKINSNYTEKYKIIVYFIEHEFMQNGKIKIKDVPKRFILSENYKIVTHFYLSSKIEDYVDVSSIDFSYYWDTEENKYYSTTCSLSNLKPTNLLELHHNSSRKEGGLRTKEIFKNSTKEKPLISIITIVYNGEKYIEHTIQSVVNQTYNNIEYIVIDAGSKDKTLEIIKKYENEIDYWISEPDKGISDAMNKGVKLCTGEFIGMIHADDWYDLDAVDQVVNSIISRECGVVCGLMQRWDGTKKSYLFSSQPALLNKAMTVNHPACFVSKGTYIKYGLYLSEYKYGMDYEIMLRFLINNVKFVSLNSVIANMRMGGESATLKSLFDAHNARKRLIPESFYSSPFYFFISFLKSTCAILLQKIGFTFVLEIYRKYFALQKKIIRT